MPNGDIVQLIMVILFLYWRSFFQAELSSIREELNCAH